jgi:hypothetical protein
MERIVLGKGNKVDDVMTREQYAKLMKKINPRFGYNKGSLGKELVGENEEGSKVIVETEVGSSIQMVFQEYSYFHEEHKEMNYFVGEGKELYIFYSGGSDEVFGSLNEQCEQQ